jgi:hypothetical protein
MQTLTSCCEDLWTRSPDFVNIQAFIVRCREQLRAHTCRYTEKIFLDEQ